MRKMFPIIFLFSSISVSVESSHEPSSDVPCADMLVPCATSPAPNNDVTSETTKGNVPRIFDASCEIVCHHATAERNDVPVPLIELDDRKTPHNLFDDPRYSKERSGLSAKDKERNAAGSLTEEKENNSLGRSDDDEINALYKSIDVPRYHEEVAGLSAQDSEENTAGPSTEGKEDTDMWHSDNDEINALYNSVNAPRYYEKDDDEAMDAPGPSYDSDTFVIRSHQFWDTQPFLLENQTHPDTLEGPIITEGRDSIRRTPYPLPAGYRWDTLDLNDMQVASEIVTLFNDDSKIPMVHENDTRFDVTYLPQFIKWALQPPGYVRDWHIGVRVIKSGRLVGFIGAFPQTVSLFHRKLKMVISNYLFVLKKLRGKKMAPVLIRELTRRVSLHGAYEGALFMDSKLLGQPCSAVNFRSRLLDVDEFIRYGCLPNGISPKTLKKSYNLPQNTIIDGFRRILRDDMPQARKIFSTYVKKKFDLYPIYNEEEFSHWFTPKTKVVDTFVVEKDGKITDLASYYILTMAGIRKEGTVDEYLNFGVAFYNIPARTNIIQLMHGTLISAKNNGISLFYAPDYMENGALTEKFKFSPGNILFYYLYNFRSPYLQPHKVGLVMSV